MKSSGFVHPTALVESDAVGAETKIWAYAHILPGATIGSRCNIGDHCFVETGAVVGDDCTIKNGNMLWEGVTLEEGVFVGPHAFFTNDLYPRARQMVPERYADKGWVAPTLVKRGASVGAAAVILGGVTIGDFAMIAAGAIVTKDVAAHALVLGNPAKLRGWVCRCGSPLKFKGKKAVCACKKKYNKTAHGIESSN